MSHYLVVCQCFTSRIGARVATVHNIPTCNNWSWLLIRVWTGEWNKTWIPEIAEVSVGTILPVNALSSLMLVLHISTWSIGRFADHSAWHMITSLNRWHQNNEMVFTKWYFACLCRRLCFTYLSWAVTI